ncbi:hypothetical protein V2J09_002701 [Rumex salicifolius]
MATSYNRSLILIFSFLFIQSNALISNTIPSFVARYCVNGTNDFNLFLQGDSRSSLMADLILHASDKTFYSTKSTIGNNTSYGLFYCTANVNSQDCQACVQTAANFCMFNMAGFVFYEECTLRYSTQPVLGVPDYESITAWSYSLSPVTYKQFNETLYSTLSQAIPKAVNGSSRFATGESSLTGTSEKLYALAQCTPDIVGSDCDTCLQVALRKMPLCDNSTCASPQRKSIITLLPSCQLGYEVRSPSSAYGTIPSTPSTSSSSPLGKYLWNIMLALVISTLQNNMINWLCQNDEDED